MCSRVPTRQSRFASRNSQLARRTLGPNASCANALLILRFDYTSCRTTTPCRPLPVPALHRTYDAQEKTAVSRFVRTGGTQHPARGAIADVAFEVRRAGCLRGIRSAARARILDSGGESGFLRR